MSPRCECEVLVLDGAKWWPDRFNGTELSDQQQKRLWLAYVQAVRELLTALLSQSVAAAETALPLICVCKGGTTSFVSELSMEDKDVFKWRSQLEAALNDLMRPGPAEVSQRRRVACAQPTNPSIGGHSGRWPDVMA